ncbi:MAG: flagellar filament capping protein FliD [Spirochaetes bacterium]|nr:flagellar filament capping protein FliD [Spirochaetota bacterium]
MSDSFIPSISDKYNTQQSIEKIMNAKKVKLTELEDEKKEIIDQKVLLNEIKANALSLQSLSKKLYGFEAPFDDKVAQSTNEAAFSASVNRNAEIGEFSLKIDEKARSHRIASDSLSRNYKIPPGEYLFYVGEDSVKFNFSGGSINDFDEALRIYGKNILRATVTNDTAKTQVLIIETEKTGADKLIGFGNDRTKSVFYKMGFYQEVTAYEKNFTLSSGNVKNLLSNQSPVFSQSGVLFLKSNEKYQFTLPENISYRKKLIMELDILAETLTLKEKQEQKAPLPTGPHFDTFGQTTIRDIELEGESQLIDIPPLKTDKNSQKPDVIIEDDHYLEIVTNKGTIEVEELAIGDNKKTLRFEMADLIEEDEIITDIIFKNNNTLKNIEVSNIIFYDEETKGGIRFTHELSKPSDALIYLDGLKIVRDSNTIDDLLKGVTLNIFDKTTKNEYLRVDRDYLKITGAIKEFIEEYNTFLDMLNKNTTSIPDPTDPEGKRGVFSGEYSLITLANKIRIMMMNPYHTTYGDQLNNIGQIGLSTNASGSRDIEKIKSQRGRIEVNEDKFIEMMEKFPDGIKSIFGSDSDNDLIVDGGLAFEVEKILKSYTSRVNGYFKLKDNAFVQSIEDQDEKISDYKELLEEEEAKLRRDFLKMEQAAEELEANQKKFDAYSNTNQ